MHRSPGGRSTPSLPEGYAWPATDESWPSPNLSTSSSDADIPLLEPVAHDEPLFPNVYETAVEVIDLISDSEGYADDEAPPPEDDDSSPCVLAIDEASPDSSDDDPFFDLDPTLVMMDENLRQEIYCLHCSILFHWTHEAINHWNSARHIQMLNFLWGKPMIYCVVCNTIPEVPGEHIVSLSQRHQKNLQRLGRPGRPTDMCLRQVVVCLDGRRRAVIVPNGMPRLPPGY